MLPTSSRTTLRLLAARAIGRSSSGSSRASTCLVNRAAFGLDSSHHAHHKHPHTAHALHTSGTFSSGDGGRAGRRQRGSMVVALSMGHVPLLPRSSSSNSKCGSGGSHRSSSSSISISGSCSHRSSSSKSSGSGTDSNTATSSTSIAPPKEKKEDEEAPMSKASATTATPHHHHADDKGFVGRNRELLATFTVVASVLCAIDCTVFPILLTVLPAAEWLGGMDLHAISHNVALYVVLPIGSTTTLSNWLLHRNVPLAAMSAGGLSLIFMSNYPGLAEVVGWMQESRVWNTLGCAMLMGSSWLAHRGKKEHHHHVGGGGGGKGGGGGGGKGEEGKEIPPPL